MQRVQQARVSHLQKLLSNCKRADANERSQLVKHLRIEVGFEVWRKDRAEMLWYSVSPQPSSLNPLLPVPQRKRPILARLQKRMRQVLMQTVTKGDLSSQALARLRDATQKSAMTVFLI